MASILIFGGVRPLGRAVVMQALRSRIYQYIRVVDMVLPQAEFLQDDELAAFEDVELIQAQLGDADGERIADLAFVHPAGRVWSVVVNAHVESRNAVDYEVGSFSPLSDPVMSSLWGTLSSPFGMIEPSRPIHPPRLSDCPCGQEAFLWCPHSSDPRRLDEMDDQGR
jgi:hypothetical protein